MISIEAVSRFRWNPELGAKLKLLRTTRKISRAALVATVAIELKSLIGESRGTIRPDSLSTKYIERLEKGEPDSIALESLQAISKALGVGADSLLSAEETILVVSNKST
jgi:transcriptional regulator with XRE-family HTH domain